MRFAQLVIGPAGCGKVRSSSCCARGGARRCRRRSRGGECAHARCAPPPTPSQSTYCETIKQHCDTIDRAVHVVNLGERGLCGASRSCVPRRVTTRRRCTCRRAALADPAAEEFKYPVSIDVRELITLEDVMQELQLGPNGWVGGSGLQGLPATAPWPPPPPPPDAGCCPPPPLRMRARAHAHQGAAVLHGVLGGEPRGVAGWRAGGVWRGRLPHIRLPRPD